MEQVETRPKFDDLQIALSVARDNLKSLNDKIGREQFRQGKNSDHRKRQHWDRDNANAQHNPFDEPRKRTGQRPDAFNGSGNVAGKRPRTNVFSRLDSKHNQSQREYEDVGIVRPKISSRVIKEMPSREEVVAAAQSDPQSRARNKRMFGSLLGTLNKFCQEESRLKPKVEKKAQIEKKVEEQEIRERETIKQERKNLFIDRKKKLMEVQLLETKMERMQDLAVWEENHKHYRDFIRTTTGPKIFFLPKVMNEKTTKLLQESQLQYEEELAKKREEIAKELVEVEERLKRELERALEQKPTHVDTEGDAEMRNVDQEPAMDEEFHSEEEDIPRPKLVSQIVRSHVVEVSIKNDVRPEKRHVLQSSINKKMIISVVNNTYEGVRGGRF